MGRERKFDIDTLSDNEFNDWIGAQIRIDMYGWVLPGNPAIAADLARKDARLSHEGVPWNVLHILLLCSSNTS